MSDVERLTSLTGWSGRGEAGTDWAQAEEELDVALPADFRELAGRFPMGTFQGYLTFNPGVYALADLCAGEVGRLRRWRDGTPDDDELEQFPGPPSRTPEFPFPLWPEPGGIFPWAEAEAGATFFWLRSGADPDSWPVVWWHGAELAWERFDGTATEFLIVLVTGQVDRARLGAPVFPPPPRFDPVIPGQPISVAG